MKPRKFHIKFEPRDIWVGVWVGEANTYICVVPCFPIVWRRG